LKGKDYVIGLGIDITELKQAEEALERSEQRLDLAHEAAGIGMFDWDIIHNQAMCNERYFRLFGLEPQDRMISEEDWLSMIHRDDRERAQKEVSQALEDRASYDTEYRVVWPDGTIKWVSSKAKIFYNDGGKPYRMIGAMMDITERKQAEDKIKTHLSFLDSVMEQSPFAMWISDTKGTVIRTNSVLRTMLNLTDEQILSKYNVLKDGNLEEQGVMNQVSRL